MLDLIWILTSIIAYGFEFIGLCLALIFVGVTITKEKPDGIIGQIYDTIFEIEVEDEEL